MEIQMHQVISGLVLALVVGVLPAQAATPPTDEEYHDRLLKLSREPGKSADAAIAQVIAETDMSDPRALLNLGIGLSSFKAYPEAIRMLSRATELAPTNEEAYRWLGYAGFWGERCDVAIPALEHVIVHPSSPPEPDKATAYRHALAGRCALHQGDPRKAIAHCRAAAALAPTDTRADICIGKAQLVSRDFEAALASFLKTARREDARQLDKDEAASYAMLALQKMGRLDEAATLLKLDPIQWPRTLVNAVVENRNKRILQLQSNATIDWQQ